MENTDNRDIDNDDCYNSDKDTDEIIRKPDEVKVEQLIDNTDSLLSPLTEEEEINMSILNSIKDQREIQKQHDEYESNVLREYEEMKMEREKQTKGIIDVLKKLAKFDKKVDETLYLIESITYAYCSGYMNNCVLDAITYDNIFNELSSIRIDKVLIETLKTIIQREK